MKPKPESPVKTTQTSLILGGARSGKSAYAEKLAEELAQPSDRQVIYLATARVLDNEIARRVKRHQQDRPGNWKTLEEPVKLADTLQKWASPRHIILVDCLTMWLNNLLAENKPQQMQNELDKLLSQLATFDGPIIFVSNEVGMGIIPMGELTRQFVDEAGRLHQQLAKQVDQVILMVAGLPHQIK